MTTSLLPSFRFHAVGILTFGAALLAAPSISAQSNGFVAPVSSPAPAPAPASTPSKNKKAAVPGSADVHNYSTGIRNGILTVDGMVGKARMNYDIKQDFLYFTVPGVGTAIVAQQHFPNSLPQKNAFKGNTLTFDVNGHTVQLTNDGPIVPGKENEAWVAIDPLYGANITFPEMGFGNTIQRPYVWPGSKEEMPAKDDKRSASAMVPPPIPVSIRPKPEVSSSYTVTVPAVEPSAAAQPPVQDKPKQ